MRRKIFLTIALLGVYRMGFWIPLPFINQQVLQESLQNMQTNQGIGQIMQVVALFSASNIGNSTIFGLGIMPYISASIIFQLLGSVVPRLQELQKEGEAGRKKINEWTRRATVVSCLFQSYFWIKALSGGVLGGGGLILDGYDTFVGHMVVTSTLTAVTVFLMLIGEQIDAY